MLVKTNGVAHNAVNTGCESNHPPKAITMKQLFEWSGMGIVVAGIVIAIVGLIVVVITQSSWFSYVIGYAVALLGIAILFLGALCDRLRSRKTETSTTWGFNRQCCSTGHYHSGLDSESRSHATALIAVLPVAEKCSLTPTAGSSCKNKPYDP